MLTSDIRHVAFILSGVLGYRVSPAHPHFRHSQLLIWLALLISRGFAASVTCVTAPDFLSPHNNGQ